MNTSALKALAFLFVFIGAIAVYSGWVMPNRQTGGTTRELSKTKPEGHDDDILTRWTLEECHGKTVHSEDLAGSVHVVSFFFATCPGSCNLQNIHLKAFAAQYGKKGVKFLSITTDPKTDSEANLLEYANRFGANRAHWYFLRSDELIYLRRVGGEVYKVHVDLQTHMDRFVLVDKWGNLRLFCDWKNAESRSELLAKIDLLLDENEPPSHLALPEDEPIRPAGYEEEYGDESEEPS
ncbi:MAG TPA: SCO family protein [Planctomycetaceae bacterium]|nr:SCO family protein [Planctomycetaceae bacterium]